MTNVEGWINSQKRYWVEQGKNPDAEAQWVRTHLADFASMIAEWEAREVVEEKEEPAPGTYDGVNLGGRELNADLKQWIDKVGSLGHGNESYDTWVGAGKPTEFAGQTFTSTGS